MAKQITPEAAAQRYHRLRDSDPVKAVQFAQQYENDAGEQDYDDYLTACHHLETYGVC